MAKKIEHFYIVNYKLFLDFLPSKNYNWTVIETLNFVQSCLFSKSIIYNN